MAALAAGFAAGRAGALPAGFAAGLAAALLAGLVGDEGLTLDKTPPPWGDQAFNHESTTGEQDDDWVDMTVGANVQLTHNLSAFAAVSQTTGLDSGEQTSYNAGIRARF